MDADERRPEGVYRGLLPARHVVASRAGEGDAGVAKSRDERLARDHDAPHPGQERLRRRDPRANAIGSSASSASTSRSTSRRSIPTSRCSTCRATPPETLLRARAIAHDAGIRFCYVGNVHDRDGQTTFCPKCGAALIRRDWHAILAYRLDDDRCADCGERISRALSSRPTWRRRDPHRRRAVSRHPRLTD